MLVSGAEREDAILQERVVRAVDNELQRILDVARTSNRVENSVRDRRISAEAECNDRAFHWLRHGLCVTPFWR